MTSLRSATKDIQLVEGRNHKNKSRFGLGYRYLELHIDLLLSLGWLRLFSEI